jgi:flagellar hook-length control protein FliK
MENLRSLSRLELGGWPSGTGRSSTSSSASPKGAERPDRAVERRSRERSDRAEGTAHRREEAERAQDRHREARADRHRRFEQRMEQAESRRSGPAASQPAAGTAGLSKFGPGESPARGSAAAQKAGAQGSQSQFRPFLGSPSQVQVSGQAEASGRAPLRGTLPAQTMKVGSESSEAPQPQGLPTSGGTAPQSTPVGALGLAPGATPGDGAAPTAADPSLEGADEARLERPAGQAQESRGLQLGPNPAAAGTEAATVEAQATPEAAGEADADPRLEASRRDAPVREAAARTSEVDTQRATRAIEQVRVQLRPGQRSAEIQLAPAELGRLSIRLKVERGNVHAVVRVEQPETLAALERFLPELRAALSAQGLDVGGMDLGLAGDAESAFSESLNGSAPPRSAGANEPDPTPALERHVNLSTHGVGEDAVDTFA